MYLSFFVCHVLACYCAYSVYVMLLTHPLSEKSKLVTDVR
jgi:hypothetical protein